MFSPFSFSSAQLEPPRYVHAPVFAKVMIDILPPFMSLRWRHAFFSVKATAFLSLSSRQYFSTVTGRRQALCVPSIDYRVSQPMPRRLRLRR